MAVDANPNTPPPNETTLLSAGDRTAVISHAGGMPALSALTRTLTDGDVAGLALAAEYPVTHGGVDAIAPASLIAESGTAWLGRPGIEGFRTDGSGWSPRFEPARIEASATSLRATADDPVAELQARVDVALDNHGLVHLHGALTNTGNTAYTLNAFRLTVPLPGTARELLTFTGRWSNEFVPERSEWNSGTIAVENRRGRTGPDRMPTGFAGTTAFSEERGEVTAVHIAWSANNDLRFETVSDGRRVMQAGEMLLPGEVVLAPGETYESPEVLLAWSDTGLNGISDQFHSWFRSRDNHPSTVRPTHLNTWEAVYFDHDLDTLKRLANKAAEVGIERWILDDGWFHGRRHDRAGLGDWWIDETVWPDGLAPIVDHVTGLGMEFGLWFEPEMVNPDSELYRNHPDWVLTDPNYDPVLARHQLVLDFTQTEVTDYLFEKISAVLSAYDIAYVKWDMNRDLVHPTHNGRATVRAHMLAVYALLERLTTTFPNIEFESCSSGGARIDARILDHTVRFWTSDCNDALDRQRIQRGFSYLFPPELMGAHVGPPTSHTTGRTHRLDFRTATALFGHFGIEWNLLDCTESELAQVAEAVAVHKRFRPLLHSGRTIRIDHPDPAAMAHGVVAHDQSEAVVCLAQIGTSNSLVVAPLRMPGLDPEANYRVEIVPLPGAEPGKQIGVLTWQESGLTASGAALANVGVQLPVLNPESALVVSATRVD